MTENNIADDELEELRLRIFGLEKDLKKFGLDPRRGVESYRPGEIKKLVYCSQNPKQVIDTLSQVLSLQEELYRKLYGLTNAAPLNVDTDVPEKNLLAIKQALTSTRKRRSSSSTKFAIAVKEVLEILQKHEQNEKLEELIISTLAKIYKRDYDRCRILTYLLERLGAKTSGHESLATLVKMLVRENRKKRKENNESSSG